MRELRTPSTNVTWPMFFDAWAHLEADFQSRYGVDLSIAIRTQSWRWFAVRAIGLLSDPASRIYRRFAPTDDE